jgi:hypothetical protein
MRVVQKLHHHQQCAENILSKPLCLLFVARDEWETVGNGSKNRRANLYHRAEAAV